MHYRNLDAAIAAAIRRCSTSDPEAQCVEGCYRCLLSYYNQPDHELIDRTDDDVLRVLLRLARGEVAPISCIDSEPAQTEHWHAALARWGLPAPDGEPLTVDGAVAAARLARASGGGRDRPVDDETRAAAEALGLRGAMVPDEPGDDAATASSSSCFGATA